MGGGHTLFIDNSDNCHMAVSFPLAVVDVDGEVAGLKCGYPLAARTKAKALFSFRVPSLLIGAGTHQGLIHVVPLSGGRLAGVDAVQKIELPGHAHVPGGPAAVGLGLLLIAPGADQHLAAC